MHLLKSYFKKLSLLFFLAVLISSCSRNPVTGKREVVFMSEAQEISMGKEADPQIVAGYGLYQDAKIQDFINTKGQEMAKISHRPHLNYEFKVLDSPVVNAFAVPGGYVYFTRGILAHFNNEAEFAGVLGHEIGHVTARHSVQQQTKAMLGQVALIGGIILSEKFRAFANEANTGMQLLFLKFGRSAESQSDELGVEYSTAIGYDSHNMANFFGTLKKLQGESGQSIPTFMSTHPDPGNRYERVHQLSDEIQTDIDATALKTNRDSYLKLIDGLIVGEDPKQGYVEDGAFYHPELLFSFDVPQNWRLNNTPSAVQMAPEDGKALLTMVLSQEVSLDATKQKLITDNKLTVQESTNTTINGNNAVTMISDQITQGQNGETNTIRILTSIIQYGNMIYVFHGMAEPADFNRYFSSFNKTMKSFAKLTDQSKINKQADMIKIKTVPSNGSFEQVMTKLGMSADQMSLLATLNGMDMDTQVKAGSLIKTLAKKPNTP